MKLKAIPKFKKKKKPLYVEKKDPVNWIGLNNIKIGNITIISWCLFNESLL